LYPLLLRTYNRNKFENSIKENVIFYYKKNGITSLKKHVDAKHTVIAKFFEGVNSLLKGKNEI
jgi:hypothetical protein